MSSLRILFYGFIGILAFSCSRENEEVKNFESDAVIVGQDFTLCPCCGGYIIEFEDDQQAYRFESLPSSSDIDLNKTNIPVSLNWSLERDCGGMKYIIVDEIIER